MPSSRRFNSHVLVLAVSLLAALTTTGRASAATPEELEARVNALASQVVTLQNEVAELKAQKAGSSAAASATTANAPATAAAPVAMAAASPQPESQVQWFGYGELNYSRPTADASAATADVARFVLGASYAFDDKTRFFSELELEHAVSSAEDPGEV